MKLGDMTVKQVSETCHKHGNCNDCPLQGPTEEDDCMVLNHCWDTEVNIDPED